MKIHVTWNFVKRHANLFVMAHHITKDCVKCGACVEQCPTDSITAGEPIFLIDADTCTDCMACIPVCPVDSIKKIKVVVKP